MPKKVTLEMKIAKRDKYKEKIEKNRAEIQPTIDAYNALDAEIKAELAQLEQKKRNAVYDHVISVFGESLSPEEVIEKFDRIMNDNRNAGIVRQLREREDERVRALETEDMTRVEELMVKHAKLIDDLNAAREKGEKTTDEELTDLEENSAVPKDPDTYNKS